MFCAVMDSVLSLKGEDGLPGEDGRKVRGVVWIVDKNVADQMLQV